MHVFVVFFFFKHKTAYELRISDWSSDVCSNDDPAGAEALLNAVIDRLGPAARAEWTQKVAWSYYIENDDANALRLATDCTGGNGAWATQGAWVRGLASWRGSEERRVGEACVRTLSTRWAPYQ